nr:SDR family NAD(P)-dependent oxidoreductase [Microvirga makkahensis]
MFPGGGSQYPRMAADLYRSEPAFAQHIDHGLRLLQERYGLDLRPLLLCESHQLDEIRMALEAPSLQLPAVFIVEYALAQILMARGVKPQALLGHSVGENTAACVAGSMSFEDCLGLVVLRGRLMDRVSGGMIAVPVSAAELQPHLDALGLDLAAVNAPNLCVASGPAADIAALEKRLGEAGIEAQRVKIEIAAHSRLLEPILDEFGAYLRSIRLTPPSIRWVSNRTGTWITDEEAIDPQYWVDHLRGTVRFADCLATLAAEPGRVFLEVGPGKTLSSLAKIQPAVKAGQAVIPTMRHADEQVPDDGFLLTALGRLWACGGSLDSERLFSGERRRRIGLPTYAFQGQRYFFEPGAGAQQGKGSESLLADREADESRWYWAPGWKMREAEDATEESLSWLVFLDDSGIGARLVERLRRRGDRVVTVRAGDSYQRLSDDAYVIAPEHGRADYDALVHDLTRSGRAPDRVAHLFLLSRTDSFRPGSSLFHRDQEQGFYSLLFFAQAWASEDSKRGLHIVTVTAGMQSVGDSDPVARPEQATVLGPVRVIPREFPDITVSCVDVDPAAFKRKRAVLRDLVEGLSLAKPVSVRAGHQAEEEAALSLLEAELRAPASNDIVAHRSLGRYLQTIRRTAVADGGEIPLRQRGVVIITGGLGGIGLTIAKELAAEREARIVLVSRTAVPDRAQWPDLARKLAACHQLLRTIAEIEAIEKLGAEVTLLQADVTNIESMRAVAQTVRQRYGAINGLVHAAGVIHDASLATKDQADIEEVLAPKVYGTLVLDEVLRDDDLDMFVVFSSTSTVTAPPGQVDYVAANAFLNAFAQARSLKGHGRTIAINWGVWSDVGMAARSAARLLRDDRAAEAQLAEHPFFDRLSVDAKGVATLEVRWSASEHWFLAEHRTAQGDALLPGAGYLELSAAALREIGIAQPFEIQDLLFLRPLAVDDAGRHVRVRLTPTPEGYGFDVAVAVDLDSNLAAGAELRTGWRRVAQAELILGEQPQLPSLDLVALEAAMPRRLPSVTKQQNHLRFGPRWDVVERVVAGEERALAYLRLADAFASDLEDFSLHPALVDLATGYAMDLIQGYTGDSLWVPVSYHKIRVQGRLPAEICSVVTVRGGSTQESGFAQFDVTITDRQGNVLIAAEKFTIKRLDAALDIGHGSSADAADVEEGQAASSDRRPSAAELAFQHNLSQGIKPNEGRRSFTRALGGYQGAQLYVSSMDLRALVTQAGAAAGLQNTTSAAEPSFARPELGSNYVAPRDEIETTLTELWRDLLGVSQVGILDNFFDLGGHSLIAVRLFAKVKRVFAVEFPISVLFEAPTIEACAALIRSARPAGDKEGDRASTGSARPRYRHLVPMHAGEGGSGRPFFLVAGMFGNVLNLRHLAHQIGVDRPFYGVQARGVYGNDAPHETFEDMAREYLEEIRLVQPQGPYTLGGFSGGGIAALEMARQLQEEGEKVDLLVMLDTPLPRSETLTWKDKIVMHLQRMRRAGPRHVLDIVQGRRAWRRRLIQEQNALGSVAQGGLHSAAIGAAFHRALERYEVRPYDGTITLFRPKLQPVHVFGPHRQINADRRFIYEDNGWTPYCRRIVVFEVPGDHDSMVLEPNVRVLATKMREAINGADKMASRTRQAVGITDAKMQQAADPIVVRSFPRQSYGASRPRRPEALKGHAMPPGATAPKERPAEAEGQRQ